MVPLAALSRCWKYALFHPGYREDKTFVLDETCLEYDVARYWCYGEVCKYTLNMQLILIVPNAKSGLMSR